MLLALCLVPGAAVVEGLAPGGASRGGIARAEERFPRPEFESGYEYPPEPNPPPPGPWAGVRDVALLVAFLVLAGLCAHRWRSRAGLFLLAIGALLYFGFYRQGCLCAVGSVQNVAAGLGDSGVPVGWLAIALFALPLLAALLVGRVFCGSVCPLGALQEVVLVRFLTVPPAVDRALRLIPWVLLIVASVLAWTGGDWLICLLDPFVHVFRMAGPPALLGVALVVLLLATVIGRPYCRYLCPYGALLGSCSRLALRRVTVTPSVCIQCHLCANACPYGAIEPPRAATLGPTRSAERRRLLGFLVALPVLVVAFAWLGGMSRGWLARFHPTLRMATAVRDFDQQRRDAAQGRGEGGGSIEADPDARGGPPPVEPPNAVKAFAQTGRPRQALFVEADATLVRLTWGGRLGGGLLGLIFGLFLLGQSLHRKQTDYKADRGRCLACGRCFDYCPLQHVQEPTELMAGRTGAGASPRPEAREGGTA